MKELTFAGRICDIDRLTGKNPADFVRKYETLFCRYLDTAKLCGILENTRGYEDYSKLLVRAKELSLSESDRSTVCTTKKNLTSVFSRLSLTDESSGTRTYYELKPLDLKSAFPVKNVSSPDITELRRTFYQEMDLLKSDAPDSYENFMIVLDRIFMKYLWCITASDHEGEDISLYDHLKVTEAILNCIDQTGAEAKKSYCLLMGDFSGIQKYIFGINSTNQSNVAKRLRARSFYVDILIRVFAQYVIERFGVTRANILLQTGGKFYLLLPDREDIDHELQELRKELDTFLYNRFHGSVSLNLAWLSIGDQGLAEYSESIVELNHRLSMAKQNAFSGLLQNDFSWNEDAFVLASDLKGKHLCPGCGSELIDRNEMLCPLCTEQIEIGRQLSHARYIIYEQHPSKGAFHVFKDYYVRLEERENFTNGTYIEALRQYIPQTAGMKAPITQKFMTNHVPRNSQGEIETFSDIADYATGMKKLGVLKADVDVLGYVFAEGFRGKEKHYGTISRVNTMSRMLEMFFSGYINEILENEDACREVYSVFAGGDDLFLIGPWNVMSDLAIRIRKKFAEFTGNSSAMTISASVTLYNDKEHIAFMADHGEKMLEAAKDGDESTLGLIHNGRKGRNCICYMQELFTWEDFESQMEIVSHLVKLLQNKVISTGMLNRISQYSTMYRKFLIDHDITGLMFDPMLSYDRMRNYGNIRGRDDMQEEIRWFTKYVSDMQVDMADYRKPKKNLYYADIAVKCALNMTRTERNNGI